MTARYRFLLSQEENGGDHIRGEGGPRGTKMARLEAVLWLAQQPLGSRKLAQLTGLADGTKARTLVRALNRLYDAEGIAFRVEEVAGGFQLMTRAKFAPWLRRLQTMTAEIRLSPPAMETLAVVAYRQPVLRAAIESIRGVQCGEILRQLIERDLVRIVGRSEELGRPLLYGTTRPFLQVFGLRHLEELPRVELLRHAGQQVAGPGDAKVGPGNADKEITNLSSHSRETGEETTVKSLTTTDVLLEQIARANATPLCGADRTPRHRDQIEAFAADEEEDEEFEEEEEEEEDDEFEDEPWEEVEDDEEFEDEDWEDEEEEDEDWDDDDWEDEEEEEEEEEKK